MHLRLIACFPLAALITFLFLLMASSWVSALERSIRGGEEPDFIRVTRFETTCEVLRRELKALSLEIENCTRTWACEGSPLLCPLLGDEELIQAYQGMQSSLASECGDSLGRPVEESLDSDFGKQFSGVELWRGGQMIESAEERSSTCEATQTSKVSPVKGPDRFRF